jgi:hypothetical protein
MRSMCPPVFCSTQALIAASVAGSPKFRVSDIHPSICPSECVDVQFWLGANHLAINSTIV